MTAPFIRVSGRTVNNLSSILAQPRFLPFVVKCKGDVAVKRDLALLCAVRPFSASKCLRLPGRVSPQMYCEKT